jgi:transposase-like protein
MHSEVLRDELLKVDRRGRVRVSAQRREALLDEFERCGVSAAEFAKQIGVRYQTFATWRQSRNKRRAARVESPVARSLPALPPATSANGMRWVEAVMDGQSVAPRSIGRATSSVLAVSLPGGARMEIADVAQAELAAVLLRVLRGNGNQAC